MYEWVLVIFQYQQQELPSTCHLRDNVDTWLCRDSTINNWVWRLMFHPPHFWNDQCIFHWPVASIRQADWCVWQSRNTFPFINAATIISRDKQSKMTHNYTPVCPSRAPPHHPTEVWRQWFHTWRLRQTSHRHQAHWPKITDTFPLWIIAGLVIY